MNVWKCSEAAVLTISVGVRDAKMISKLLLAKTESISLLFEVTQFRHTKLVLAVKYKVLAVWLSGKFGVVGLGWNKFSKSIFPEKILVFCSSWKIYFCKIVICTLFIPGNFNSENFIVEFKFISLQEAFSYKSIKSSVRYYTIPLLFNFSSFKSNLNRF